MCRYLLLNIMMLDQIYSPSRLSWFLTLSNTMKTVVCYMFTATTHVYYPDFTCKILSDRHTLIELKSVMSKNKII